MVKVQNHPSTNPCIYHQSDYSTHMSLFRVKYKVAQLPVLNNATFLVQVALTFVQLLHLATLSPRDQCVGAMPVPTSVCVFGTAET